MAFSCYPNLKIQDLNKPDINIIIKKAFLEAEEIVHLSHDEPKAIQRLADEIRYKAQGVLLWVRLVIIDLLRGFGNLDTMS